MITRKKLINTLINKREVWNRWVRAGGRASLTHANLSCADLRGACLTCAALAVADLSGASLTRADLSGASLIGANLSGASLIGANLTGTCLDPANPCSEPEKVRAGLEALGIHVNASGNFSAWRTQRSAYSGNTVYEPGTTYRAPWFSTDESTECHPGLYFGTKGDALGLSKHVVRISRNLMQRLSE